jgi:hypothetical protein
VLVDPLTQSRTASFVEAATNVAAGFVLAIFVQRGLYPLFGIRTDLVQDGAIATAFTAVSLARSYAIRRLFAAVEANRERDRHNRAHRLKLRLAATPLRKPLVKN